MHNYGYNLFQKKDILKNQESIIFKNLSEAIERSEIKDGMTISFHHHYRDGDLLLNMVMDLLAEKGLKDLILVVTSLRNHHKLGNHIKNGVINKIYTTGLRGKLGKLIKKGIMDHPVVFYSHGGRAAAIASGRIKVDIAFIAASIADQFGNINGVLGKSICGSLGYAKVDATYAKTVIAVVEKIASRPLEIVSIPQKHVDYIVQIDKIGESNKIATGSLRQQSNTRDLSIARQVAEVIISLENFKDGYSLQTGSGSISLGVNSFIENFMINKKIKGNFLLGGVTADHVNMLKKGLFNKIYDTQTFHPDAIESLKNNVHHQEIDAVTYASPFNKRALVNYLDFVVLSALEIDLNFNVNVLTAANGDFYGAIGGHSDTAAGAKVSIVTAPSYRGRIPSITEQVKTIVTPGHTIDILVTERGVAVNPARKDLLDQLKTNSKINLKKINRIYDEVIELTGKPEEVNHTGKVVGLVEYRDGSLIDVIYGEEL